jgi:hypothetical protein
MNLTNLTRNYDLLSPWERVPLIMAADARGDDGERERLAGSAPKRATFVFPDHWGLVHGLDQLAVVHVLSQLDMATLYWRMSLVMAEPPFLRRKEDREREKRWWNMLRMIAYRTVTRAEAWKLLAAELQIDPDQPLRDVPGYENMRMAEETMRYTAYSREEAIEYMGDMARQQEPAADTESRAIHVESAAEVAALMREYLEQSLKEWT